MYFRTTSLSLDELAYVMFKTVVENNGLSGRITRHYHHLAVCLCLCLLGIRNHTVLLHMNLNIVAEIPPLNNVINTH
jgi:hypothetical protein